MYLALLLNLDFRIQWNEDYSDYEYILVILCHERYLLYLVKNKFTVLKPSSIRTSLNKTLYTK